MKLVAHGFSGNTTLRGTLTAVDDGFNPLGWEANGNWSSPNFRTGASKDLVASTGITEDKARALIARALQEARRQAGVPVPGQEPTTLHTHPIICVNGRQPREVKADIWQVIGDVNKAKPQFFALGSAIVHLEHGVAGPFLHTLTLPGLRDHLEHLADFIAIDEEGKEHPSKPPRDILEDLLALAQPPLPVMRGIVRTPVLTSDWKVLLTEGYHSSHGLYLSLEGVIIPPMPDKPPESEITHAKALLLEELLPDFPFATDADRAHAVAALLTPIVRPAIAGPTPLFLIEAPMPGTGKGLLDSIIGLIITGGETAVMTEARDEDEWRKRITAKLKQAPVLVVIDNVRLPLHSAALSAALTEPVFEDRELGVNRMLRLPVRCTWLATGNNVALSGEIARRTVRIRMDAEMECPWERDGFRHDPLEGWVQKHRGELLWALLTLVKAWVAAGRPPAQARMGRFQQWADMVGGMLGVVDIPGFLSNRDEVYALAAAELVGWLAFVELWWATYGEQRVGVDRLFELAKQRKLLTELRAGRMDQGARVALGKELASLRDRIIGEWTIRWAGSGHGVQAYRLEPQVEKSSKTAEGAGKSQQSPPPPKAAGGPTQGGDGGDGGDFPDPHRSAEKKVEGDKGKPLFPLLGEEIQLQCPQHGLVPHRFILGKGRVCCICLVSSGEVAS